MIAKKLFNKRGIMLTSKQIKLFHTDINTLWSILTQSQYTTQYMFNCTVETDWVVGSDIVWQGNYQGYQAYQKGKVLEVLPNEKVKYSTFDPNVGLSDIDEHYIHVTYLLESKDESVQLTIINETFDNNNERMQHIEQGWQLVLTALEEVVTKH